MGCELSKLSPRGVVEEDHDPYHQPPPPSDPRSPLTAKQQYCMLASWKGIFRAMEKTGIVLFIKLFEENEELLHLFEKFKEHTHLELSTSTELSEHATNLIQSFYSSYLVMKTLDEGIKTLGNIDDFFLFVRQVGATHHQVPGFKAENFWKIEQPFLEAAKTTLGERYTPNIENIYQLTIRFILENLVKGYEESTSKTNGVQNEEM